MRKSENIEFQEIIAEANEGGYQPVRFTRIKYKNNPMVFIDIRVFQRGYSHSEDDDGEEYAYYPTKKGFQIPEREFGKVIKRWTIIPSAYMHPDIMDRSFELMAKRQFESAVLQAYKCIEIKIREITNSSKDEYGVRLIRKSFDPQKGKLTNFDLPVGEREALSNYIAGAYGLYKNPCSHRDVKMSFYEAFEKIVVASNILKIIEESTMDNKIKE